MARGGAEQKIDERGYREDRRDGRAPGMELGGHRLDESTEAVGHGEQREHREKGREHDHPGLRRIRLGGHDSAKQAGGLSRGITELGVKCGVHRSELSLAFGFCIAR